MCCEGASESSVDAAAAARSFNWRGERRAVGQHRSLLSAPQRLSGLSLSSVWWPLFQRAETRGGAATSYADEMLIRRKVNEVWTRTNQPGGGQCGNEEAAASPPLFILRSFSNFIHSSLHPTFFHPFTHLSPSLTHPSFSHTLPPSLRSSFHPSLIRSSFLSRDEDEGEDPPLAHD